MVFSTHGVIPGKDLLKKGNPPPISWKPQTPNPMSSLGLPYTKGRGRTLPSAVFRKPVASSTAPVRASGAFAAASPRDQRCTPSTNEEGESGRCSPRPYSPRPYETLDEVLPTFDLQQRKPLLPAQPRACKESLNPKLGPKP